MSPDDWSDDDAVGAAIVVGWVLIGIPLAFFGVWLLVTR